MLVFFLIGFVSLYSIVCAVNRFSLSMPCSRISLLDIISRNLVANKLETVIRSQELNHTIVLYCTDSGYINLFLNAYYASNLHNYKNLVVTCFDRSCYRTLSALNISVAILNIGSDTSVNTNTASTWGTKAFQNKVQWKLVMLMRALATNVRVLYIDSDIILLKNPFPYLNSIRGYDIISQKDTTICSGFMYLYPTNITKLVIRKAAVLRPKLLNAGDQKAILTAVAQTPNIKIHLLPINMFSSGEIFFNSHSYYWDQINTTQIMIHNNFIIGTKNKLYRFKELKMYKLNVNNEYSNPESRYITFELWSELYIDA